MVSCAEEFWGPKRKAGRLLKEGADGDKVVKTKSKRGGRKKELEKEEAESELVTKEAEGNAGDVIGDVPIDSDSKECNSSNSNGKTGVEVEVEHVAETETEIENRKRPRTDALELP